jgi:pyruvate formate lyase activating enzyme
MMLWTTTGKGAKCDICPHECNLAEGQHGLCKSRVNRGGKIISEVYGHLCALNIDPVEKKPLLHFHQGSNCLSIASTGCNLACRNCQNWEVSQAMPSEVNSIDMSPEHLIMMCISKRCRTIAYTYTEPLTWYEYTRDCAELAHRHGISNILVSAGYINPAPLKEIAPLIDAANIDLKSFSNEIYQKINHASLAPVLATLVTLLKAGTWLEITNLVIPGINDDEELIRQMCRWLKENGFADCPLHFSRFFPNYMMRDTQPTPLKTLLMAHDIAIDEGMHFVYIGNVGEIEGENTTCPDCGKILVRRDGYTVLDNRIKSGCCPDCGTKIAGIW